MRETLMAHEYSVCLVNTTVRNTITRSNLELWYRNHVTRRALSRVTADSLRDAGISEADRAIEIAKPFWR